MKRVAALAAVAALTACAESSVEPNPADSGPSFATVAAELDARLVEVGDDVVLHSAEYLTMGENGELGRTVFFNDRGNMQTPSHFVEGDARRSWNGGTGITWAIDGTQGATASGLTQGGTNQAIFDAMETWQSVQCSNLPLEYVGQAPFDYGFVQWLFGFGGAPFVAADLVHAGFLPGAFFDLLAPGGSNFILGVTFTLNWIGGDTDGDGRGDAALREIYYNDAFGWNEGSRFDVETVALHEAGHGLSQDHFGTAFRTDANGKIHFAPRAVMNASYSGVQTEIGRTDKAGHCNNWGEWGRGGKN